MTIIDIRPFQNGWQVYEAPSVQPVFLSQEHAIDYAACRACFRCGEIRILDSLATLSVRSISAKQTENCSAGELHSGMETNCSDAQNLSLHKNQSFFYDPIRIDVCGLLGLRNG
jgi:hypothetical protein